MWSICYENNCKKMDIKKSAAEIFEIFKDEIDSVFLDTSLPNKNNNFSIIGINPYLKLVNKNGILYVNNEQMDMTFEEYLREYLSENKEINDYNLPIIFGGIGYFSYEYGCKLQGITDITEEEIIPECVVVFYDNFIIEDLKSGEIFVTSSGQCETPELFFEKIEALLKKKITHKKAEETSRIKVHINFTEEEYMEAVNDMRSHIYEGDIYVVNQTRRLTVESQRTPYEVFQYMRTSNPAPYSAYMNYGDFAIVSVSPECFLNMKKGNIITRPIKGTRKRGSNEEEDRILKQELMYSDKDRSCNLNIVI